MTMLTRTVVRWLYIAIINKVLHRFKALVNLIMLSATVYTKYLLYIYN